MTTTSHDTDMTVRTAAASLLWPRSVAVIGAAASPKKVGGRFVDFLRRGGFPGPVIEVNPRRAAEPDVHAALRDVGSPVDVTVVAVPSGQVADALSGAEHLLRNVVVVTSGYQETGAAIDPGAQRDLDYLTGLVDAGVGILGPNCNGYYHAGARTIVTFAPVFESLLSCPTGSGVVMITQSGAYGARFASACQRRGVPLEAYINTGNELGYRAGALLGDVLDVLPGMRAAVLYLEGVRDPEPLLGSVRKATERGVSVLVLQAGVSAQGRRGAQSHTAAITPPAKVIRDLLEYAGATVVDADADLLDAATLLATVGPLPAHPRVGVITISGGVGVLAADRCDRDGLSLPELTAGTQEAIAAHLPAFATVTNPVDMTGHAVPDPDYQRKVAAALAGSNEVDAVLACVPQAFVGQVADGVDGQAATLAILLDGTTEEVHALAERQVPAFTSVSAAVDAIANARRRVVGPLAATDVQRTSLPATDSLSAAFEAVGAMGIPIPPMAVVNDVADAVAAAAHLGWPITAKADCDSSVHKKAQGLIRLGLSDEGQLSAAVEELLTRSPAVVLQPHLPVLTEFLIGARRVEDVGTVVVCGLGGSLAEALRLSIVLPSLASAPAIPTALRDGRRLHQVVPDIDRWWAQLLEIGRALAAVCDRGNYSAVETNPVAVTERGLFALDVRFVRDEGQLA